MKRVELENKINNALQDNSSQEFNDLNKAKNTYSQSKRTYGTLHFLVHPGWAANNFYDEEWEEPERKEYFIREFYPEYISGIKQILEQSSERNPIHVIYDTGAKSHTETLLNKLSESPEITEYTQSEENDGELPEQNLGEIQDSMGDLEEDGKAVVHGEIKGRCDEAFKLQLEELKQPEQEIEDGITFPPKPTWNYAFQ